MTLIYKLIVPLLFTASLAQAQKSLYMPIEFQRAYNNQTRSYDGYPGENYWQNFSKYDIKAKVIPKSWQIEGEATITYINNSPNSLQRIIVKTFPNHYKKGAARDTEVQLINLTDGMQFSFLSIDGDTISLANNETFSQQNTWASIALKEKLLPEDSLKLTIHWKSELPLKYKNRIGAYDSTSAFAGYWYPQIAVYDDIDGWDRFQYLGTQEFYRDFADFKVTLDVPSGFRVWATGELQNAHEVLDKNSAERLEYIQQSNETEVLSARASNMGINEFKSWEFTAKNVTDFAFGISNNFQWQISSLKTNDKEIVSNFVYNAKDSLFLKDIIDVQNKAISYFSNEMPGVPYPYPQFTSFFGVPEPDGMEFPMLANNGASHSDTTYKTPFMIGRNASVTVHELAHTYFPYYVGVNEVKYSWMEEGMAVFLTAKFFEDVYKHKKASERYFKGVRFSMGTQWESPLFAPSNHLVYRRFHSHLSYSKPAVMYFMLEDLLGKELFRTCLQEYMSRWAGKHPTPYDMILTFNDVSKRDLNWFWKPWIFEYGYADLALKKVNGNKLSIENTGQLPVSIYLRVHKQDEKEIIVHKNASVWSKGENEVIIKIPDIKNVAYVELMTEKTPDVYLLNNKITLRDQN